MVLSLLAGGASPARRSRCGRWNKVKEPAVVQRALDTFADHGRDTLTGDELPHRARVRARLNGDDTGLVRGELTTGSGRVHAAILAAL
jgi:hypothetical protein